MRFNGSTRPIFSACGVKEAFSMTNGTNYFNMSSFKRKLKLLAELNWKCINNSLIPFVERSDCFSYRQVNEDYHA